MLVIYWVSCDLNIKIINLFPISEYIRIAVVSIISGIPIMVLHKMNFLLSEFTFVIISTIVFFCSLIIGYILVVLKSKDYEEINQYCSKVPVVNSIVSYLANNWIRL